MLGSSRLLVLRLVAPDFRRAYSHGAKNECPRSRSDDLVIDTPGLAVLPSFLSLSKVRRASPFYCNFISGIGQGQAYLGSLGRLRIKFMTRNAFLISHHKRAG